MQFVDTVGALKVVTGAIASLTITPGKTPFPSKEVQQRFA
jgi:hypothetical protein